MKIRRILSVFLACLMLGTACLRVTAFAEPKEAPKTNAAGLPEFTARAKAALLVDESCDRVLLDQNAHDKMYPASLTKIMTAYLTLEAVSKGQLTMNQTVTVSNSAMQGLDEDGSTAGIVAGEKISIENLLYCLMVVSANEAANILAEAVSGSIDEFVKLMNQKVQELGLKDTHFVNPTGLHNPNHYTTAWDMYKITQAAMKYEQFMTICNTKAYEVPATNKSDVRELHSTNFLISTWLNTGYFYDREDINAYAEGVKTGTNFQNPNVFFSSLILSFSPS